MKYRIKLFLKFLVFITFISIQVNFLKSSESLIQNNEIIKNDETNSLKDNFYILGPGDVLSIKFVGVQELSGNFTVMRDGNIQLPLLGSKNISGYTLDDATSRIAELYKDDLISPEIYLSLLKARPVRISLIGEVQRPGSYTLDIGESSRVQSSSGSGTSIAGYKTVVDAIQKSGGLTFDADITKVKLYRKLPGNENRFKTVELDLLKMIRTGDQINNPILFDGDLIVVNKQTIDKNRIENIPNNLIPETINLHIVGEVSSPGKYQVDSKTKVSQAILIAGGPNSWRYKDKVQILRVKRNGSVEVKKISFNKQGLSKGMENFSLRNGDIIRVNKNLFGKTSDAMGSFLPPIRDIYSLYGIYKLIE